MIHATAQDQPPGRSRKDNKHFNGFSAHAGCYISNTGALALADHWVLDMIGIYPGLLHRSNIQSPRLICGQETKEYYRADMTLGVTNFQRVVFWY
jgi:hypothetical protein